MNGQFTPAETLERLRKEAKRRLKEFRRGNEHAVLWYQRAVPDAPANPTLRDMQLAVARSHDFPGWTALKHALEQPLPDPESALGIVQRFLDNACPDHHVRGLQDHRRAEATAMRLLSRHPELARHDFNTAIVCGEIDFVRDTIARDPGIVARPSEAPSACRAMVGGSNDLYASLGPKGWTPLLFLAFTRLPIAASIENSAAIARLMLEAGADANAFFHAGDSLYTPMTGVAGHGEEDRPPHPRRHELTQLLLDFGANPYDIQVVYNLGFNADYQWWLPMIHERSVKTGHGDDWRDPEWRMLSMGAYGCGARWFLEHALANHSADLVQWCLEHGADPNVRPSPKGRMPARTLYELAIESGQSDIAELLVRFGAQRVPVAIASERALIHAAMSLDRSRVEAIVRENPALRSSPDPLFQAAEQNRADVIHLLIDAGFSPNAADDNNTRALNHAAWSSAAEAARALIARGAEIDAVEENYGGTAFGNASHFLHNDVIEILVPLTHDVWNLTYNGHVERLRAVLAEKPERARVDWDEWSPLLWLPPHDEDVALEMLKLFVHHGADPHRRDSNGVAPLDRVKALGMTKVAAYLSGLPTEKT